MEKKEKGNGNPPKNLPKTVGRKKNQRQRKERKKNEDSTAEKSEKEDEKKTNGKRWKRKINETKK